MKQCAGNINILGKFCGKRDISALTSEELYQKYGIEQVDVMVLIGGSILCGGDVMAQAMKNGIAKKYVIVGGVGHTTDILRGNLQNEFPQIDVKNMAEANIFNSYLMHKYGLQADFLECESTNSGNNITNLLALLEKHAIDFRSILLVNDATMQYRIEATLRKYVSDDIKIINYAAYQAKVMVHDTELVFEENIPGMWEMDRYITLLMGEIPRLTDNENGYGPKGKGFIVHVDIPQDVGLAFEALKCVYPDKVREANPAYASRR